MKAAAVALCLVLLTPLAAHPADEPKPKTITIRGETYTVVPDEKLRALGFEFANIPPEDNAATDYLKAFETHRLPEKGPKYEALKKALSDDQPKNLAPLVEDYL